MNLLQRLRASLSPRQGLRLNLSLYWRTFTYLVLLLTGCILAWVQTFNALEFQPQALQSARQVASMVNLTRAALEHADAIARVSLVKTLADEERLRIAPREPGDSYSGYGTDPFSRQVAAELEDHLGAGTIVARDVNGFPGLWVAFTMDKDSYWLLLDPRRVASIQGRTWLIWLVIAALLSLTGAAVLARLINQPLQALSLATAKVREGQLAASHLNEDVSTPEIRAVNRGFNRMAQELARVDTDRQLMLAGISHDLRTPLARLRLEAEMSVPDPQARDDMVADLAQVNSIIEKFMEYARPSATALQVVEVTELMHAAVTSQGNHAAGLKVSVDAHHEQKPKQGPDPMQDDTDLLAWADPVDLLRVLNNLLENACRYGKTPVPDGEPSVADVQMSAQVQGPWVCLSVSDRGTGVDAATLSRLTQPFFRADSARSQASGAGLGLAVVKKMLARMGGELELQSPGASGHGLTALVRLRRLVPEKATHQAAKTHANPEN
jgi:two-component system osmolarity sensor histidine kinase EnvZ